MTCVYCGASNDGAAVSCFSCGRNFAEPDRPAQPQVQVQPSESEFGNPSLAPELWNTAPQSNTNLRPLQPSALKVVGYGNVAFGPLLALVNLIVVGRSISVLEARNAPEGLNIFFEINIAIFCVVGTLLLIGGVGLLRNRNWGRIWSFAAGIFCLLAYLAAAMVSSVMQSMLTSGVIPLRPGQQSFYFKEVSGVTGFAPLYGIVIIILLMLPDSRAWARGGVTAPATGDRTGFVGGGRTLAPPARTSKLAVASLICSIIPLALLTQIAGLTMGLIALWKIKKSEGALGGRGFAIAGVIISSLILLLIVAILLMVLLLRK